MTNKELVEKLTGGNPRPNETFTTDDVEFMLNMLREKMQGVDVWVGWDSAKHSDMLYSYAKPKEYHDKDGVTYNGVDFYGNVLGLFQIEPGQCAKFRIVREEDV